MSLLTFPEPITATFSGGDFDGLEIPMTHAYDRVRPEVTDRGIELNPILAPEDWIPKTPGYYLRTTHEHPINYMHF